MKQFDLNDLPGIGWSTFGKLKELNIQNVTTCLETDQEVFCKHLGQQNGTRLFNFIRGLNE